MKKRISVLFLCLIMCVSIIPSTALAAGRSTYYEEGLAEDLKELGLFKGVSDTDFDLERKPTRVEALIMLIRLLGKDEEATESSYSHPFTDVPDWADNYIGYAYENGITNGISDTLFGTDDANAQMYLTFVLRALGYSDEGGADFLWNNPYTLAKTVGILPDCVNTTEFIRADVVLVSYAALSANTKNSSQPLAQKLIADGVFTYEQYLVNYDVDAIKNYTTAPPELTAEQVYDKCSSAVFYVEVYDEYGEAFASGSGFFINSQGVAVTNYHVIEDALSATITLSETEQVYDITGVYDYNIEQDWAVIQVDVSNTPYLAIGDSSTVTSGATVYAIGSPLGLQNTISQGLISNTNRVFDGISFIQTSAAISSGSSGGALINKYGQVIGITSASFADGQNLNLALPISVIEGYDSTSIASLADIFGEQTIDPEYPEYPDYEEDDIAPFAMLCAFARVYANDDMNGKPTYTEEYETENGFVQFGIIDNELYPSVYAYEVYDEDVYYFEMDFEYGTTDQFLGYFYNLGESYSCSGYKILDTTSFTGNYAITFDEFEGRADRETNEEICTYYIIDALDFVNYIFEEYLTDFGYYTVYDLGFTNY